MNDERLHIYLNDHLAGSVEAVELIKHFLASNPDGTLAASLRELLAEIKQDQAVLRDLRSRVKGRESRVKDAIAWLLDKLSRLKLNEFSRHRDLNRLEKLEELLLGVRGKLALWASLEAASGSDDRFSDVDFPELKQRAQQQLEEIERHRLEAARKAFAGTEQTTALP